MGSMWMVPKKKKNNDCEILRAPEANQQLNSSLDPGASEVSLVGKRRVPEQKTRLEHKIRVNMQLILAVNIVSQCVNVSQILSTSEFIGLTYLFLMLYDMEREICNICLTRLSIT